MTDNEENLVTLKIREEARDWVDAEQRRIKHAGGKKPTQAQLFDRMREAYEKSQGEGGSRSQRAEAPMKPVLVERKHSDQHSLLEYVLEHGTKEDAAWITGNLKNFAEAIGSRQSHGTPAKRKRASNL